MHELEIRKSRRRQKCRERVHQRWQTVIEGMSQKLKNHHNKATTKWRSSWKWRKTTIDGNHLDCQEKTSKSLCRWQMVDVRDVRCQRGRVLGRTMVRVSLYFRSFCPILWVRVFSGSSFQLLNSFVNGLYFWLAMDPFNFSSYKYAFMSFLLRQPLKIYNWR